MRSQSSIGLPGYDLGKEESDVKGETKEKDEDVEVEVKDEETYVIQPLGHQGKLILQSVGDMFHDHNQALHDKLDKQDEWHKKMYETLAIMMLIGRICYGRVLQAWRGR